MEKPSPHLSNEIKALSQILVFGKGPSSPDSKEGECSLFMILLQPKSLPQWDLYTKSFVWEHDLRIAEARWGLQRHYN